MDKDQFISEYCARSGVTWEWLRQHKAALPCTCGEDGCAGWAMVSNNVHSSQALVARHPFKPGAMGYINSEHMNTENGQRLMHEWLDKGAILALVPLHQAIGELSEYTAAELAIPPPADDMPRMLLKQAD